MLPTELSYLAQERCKEFRGETRRPSTMFFEISSRKMLANFFSSLGDKFPTKPKARVTQKSKITEF
jgi:hypothetical protein